MTQEVTEAPITVELRHIDSLIPYARNARTHSAHQILQIAASIKEFGFTNPILADETGIVAGHGRVMAVRKLLDSGGTVKLPNGKILRDGMVPVIDCTGWDETKRKAYILADNQLATLADWDAEMLTVELQDLRAEGFDLALAGFGPDEIEAAGVDLGTGEGTGVSAESVLDRMEVCVGEPQHEVEHGDHWILGGQHHLIVAKVMTEWSAWRNLLDGERVVFVPYPGMFAALAYKAREFVLVMVQPDVYIAGHILDRYSEIHGEGSVRKAGQ